MNHHPFRSWLLATFLLAAGSVRGQETSALGELTFDVSASEEAKPAFLKGLLLLHSFEFADAADAFREAQEIDPACAMAYWGEAMTYNHAIWHEQDFERGRAVLQKLGDTASERAAKGETDLEKDFIKAAGILYGEGTKFDRDKAYAEHMGVLHEKYPESHEIAALYALSLLGSVPVGRDVSVYQRSAWISEGILRENPRHPGALHYLIHANDDPSHAKSALFAANAYSVVAPDAAHALHMPTHIYVALGMWDEVIRLNVESWQASVRRKEEKNLSNDALGYHSFHWLEYGYLQKGRVEDARQMLSDMIRYCAELPSPRARTHEIYLKATFLVETNEWNSTYASQQTDASGLNVSTRGIEKFVRGMKLYHEGDIAGLKKHIAGMDDERLFESARITRDGTTFCSSGGASRENATRLDVDQLYVMEMQLEGLSSWRQNELAAADKWLREASELEARISYSYGPPAIPKPAHELYGEFLLTMKRPENAMKTFDIALQRAPRRVLALKGKMQAARMMKRADSVREIEEELKEIAAL